MKIPGKRFCFPSFFIRNEFSPSSTTMKVCPANRSGCLTDLTDKIVDDWRDAFHVSRVCGKVDYATVKLSATGPAYAYERLREGASSLASHGNATHRIAMQHDATYRKITHRNGYRKRQLHRCLSRFQKENAQMSTAPNTCRRFAVRKEAFQLFTGAEVCRP